MVNPQLSAALREIPKTETHLHIEGALPFGLLKSLGKNFPRPDSWNANFRFKSFAEFDNCLLSMAGEWYVSPERYHRAAREIFSRMRDENVRYAEVSFASGMIEFLGIPGDEIAEAISKSAPAGLEVRVFMGIHRNGCPPKMERVFGECANWEYLCGLDLHGDETLPLEDWTVRLWRDAARSGLRVKAHAGELCGAESVRQIVEKLGVRQIEHGVRAAENAEVVEWLAERGVRFDVCPTSNVKLGVFSDYRNHPMRELRNARIACTLSSDDPLVFNSTLAGEYDILHAEMGFSAGECFDVAADGWRFADVPQNARDEFLREIERARSGFA